MIENALNAMKVQNLIIYVKGCKEVEPFLGSALFVLYRNFSKYPICKD